MTEWKTQHKKKTLIYFYNWPFFPYNNINSNLSLILRYWKRIWLFWWLKTKTMLDKLFVKRIHLRIVYIYGNESLINVTRHRLNQYYFSVCNRNACWCWSVTLKTTKIKSTFNHSSILHSVHFKVSYRSLWFVFLIVAARSSIKWPEMQSSSHFAYAKKSKQTNKEEIYIKFESAKFENGYHGTALYRSFLINCWIYFNRNVIFFKGGRIHCCVQWCRHSKIKRIPNTNTNISAFKRFIAQIGHIFI